MTVLQAEIEYIAAGGNRHPSAADWAPGLLLFGAGKNVALWNPEDGSAKGISALLKGHTDVVNAVKIYDSQEGRCIITGGADKTIRIWGQSLQQGPFEEAHCLSDGNGSINTISVLPERQLFVTGSADGHLKVWNFFGVDAKLVQSLKLKPHYIPLASALIELNSGVVVLAVSGTSTSIQLYTSTAIDVDFVLQATLPGHEGWIRSLDFVKESHDESSDILLASASQDKYIRLWRFHTSSNIDVNLLNGAIDSSLPKLKPSLSSKAHQVGTTGMKYIVTFEALLIGHEDWIYTARWALPTNDRSGISLLSASADNSLSIWEADDSSGVWICRTRLGEISAQKGSTTATGSTGGFWIGLWSPDGNGMACLARTGSWRRWKYDPYNDTWRQQLGISGHTQEVQSLAWAPNGSYLVSTSSDQTTRLFASWQRDDKHTWHEFARPQIHGYDLNGIDTISRNQIISGADEKLLRVFSMPKSIGHLLSNLCAIENVASAELPDAADIPVLRLSNKAISIGPDGGSQANGTLQHEITELDVAESATGLSKSSLDLDHPPFEEHLSRHTLWPEHEKLYGHGYEISAVAASHNSTIVATACKASSIDHAVIRVYECEEWREVKPPLTAHSLTVTALAFSPDDRYLLSVGRDRQWAVFARSKDDSHVYTLLASNLKGHSRMILDCSWADSRDGRVFATAGRDKAVKVWRLDSDDTVACVATISASTAVTGIAFDQCSDEGNLRLALGTENGDIKIANFSSLSLEVTAVSSLPESLLPSGAINALRWRPRGPASESGPLAGSNPRLLAVASDDSSLRILRVPP